MQYLTFIAAIGEMDMLELQRVGVERLPAWDRQWRRNINYSRLRVNYFEQSLARRSRVAEKLKGLCQGLNSLKAGQDHQGQKAQIDSVDGLCRHKRDSQDQYRPQCHVHREIVQALLEPADEGHTPLDLPKRAVKRGDLLLLLARVPIREEVLHALDAVYNLRVQLGARCDLLLAPAASESARQQRYSSTSNHKKC